MNEETFMQALHDDPADEVTWLALADWLDEDGQNERAEMLRLVRQLRKFPVMKRTKAKTAMHRRIVALLAAEVRPVAPEITNSIGMRLALIPAGRFCMGSPYSVKGFDNQGETPRVVELKQPFYLAVFSVTQAQYRAVVGSEPSYFCVSGPGREELAGMDTRDLPVEQVAWHEAVEFCQLLTKREHKSRPGMAYRLPSEAEWEYACKGGTASSSHFHFGSSLSSTQANFNGMYPYRAELGPWLRRPAPVGSYRPNVFGLYDMHGNINDWCAAEAGEDDSVRYCRGGGWRNSADLCRAAYRYKCGVQFSDQNHGFRVALAASA